MILSSRKMTLPTKIKTTRVKFIQIALLLCLAQRVIVQSVDIVQSNCTLGSEDVSSLLDSEARMWDLNGSALETYGLQSIVDCAAEDDTIRMRAETLIRPETTIRIERGVTIEGVSVDSTKITCPPDRALFRITQAVNVSLRKFTVEGCRISKEADTKSIITSSGSCFANDPQPLGSLEVIDVVIQRNANEGGGVVPHFDHPSCFSLKLERVGFISNVIDGSSLLASVNNLTDVTVKGNVVEHQARNSFFNFPRKSYNVAERLSAVRNKGSILRGRRSAVTFLSSEFRSNRLQSGRLLYFRRSYIIMNGVLFESNLCGTAWGCVLIEKGRTADLHSVSFLSNSLQNNFFVIKHQRNTNLISCVIDSNKSQGPNNDLSIVYFTFRPKQRLFLGDITARNNVSPGPVFSVAGNNESSVTVERSFFEGNQNSGSGTMYVYDTNYVNISRVHFIDNQSQESGAIYLIYCSNVRVDSSTFERNSAAEFGGGIRLLNCESVTCVNSIFEGNSAHAGGGSSIEIDLQTINFAKFVNCKFKNNTARTVGGGLAILYVSLSTNSKAVLKSTLLQSNHAQISGGGIFVHDNAVLTTDCGLEEYSRENASLLRPARSASSRQGCRWFKGNTVGERGYGNNKASSARDYYFFLMKKPLIAEGLEGDSAEPNREYYQPRRKGNGEADIWTLAADRPTATERNESHRMRFGDALVIENWRPGDPLPVFEVFPVDRYGQSPAVVRIGSYPHFRNPELRAKAELGTGSSRFILQRGTPMRTKSAGLLEVLDYAATPDKVSFTVEIEGLLSNTSKVNITFRECIINEEFPGGNLCKDCPLNTYNFDPTSEAASCSECPENLDCSTRFVFPQKEYWNSFPCSVQAQRCINPDACRYRPNGTRIDLTDRRDCTFNETEIELYWEDQCVEGHKGRLCAECKDGYGSAGAYTCGACRSPALAIVLSLIAFAVVFGVSLLQIGSVIELKAAAEALFRVRSLPDVDDPGQPEVERCEVLEDGVNSSRRRDRSRLHILSECFLLERRPISGINFLQTTTAAASMDVSWTETLKQLFKVQRWIGGDPVEATSFSTECLLSGDARTLVRQIVIASVPLLVILIQSSYFFKSFASNQIDGSTFLKRCALILIVVFYVCYVSLARTAFALLYCVNITVSTSLEDDSSPEKFWAMDTSKRCFVRSHLVLVQTVALPILILTFFFPILVAASTVVVRSKKKLGSESALDTLGILYRGFNEETVYWDSLILLRKALIVGILTFGYNLGGTLQGQACVCVLVIALYLQTVFRPFRVDLGNLNGIESFSLLVSILTFLGGVTIDDPRMQSTTAEYILISLIVAGNAGFILFICHQLLESKWAEIKFSLLESGVDIEHKSPMSIFKAWTVLSVSSSVETLTGSFVKMIEKSRKEAMDEDEGVVVATGA